MTPAQRIKRHILLAATESDDDLSWGGGELTAENTDEAYESVLVEADAHWDFESEFRSSGLETDIPCEVSRHYESDSVARKLSDGTWVGWTYWYGGGKHGRPEELEWMEDAYGVEVTEEKKLVTVRTFKQTE